MLIPAPVEQLNESDSALDHATGQQAIPGESAVGGAIADAIGFEGGGGLAGQVGEFRDAGLHPISHLVLRDPGIDFRVPKGIGSHRIEGAGGIEHAASGGGIHAGRVAQEEDGIALGTESNALMFAGEEAAPPVAGAQGLVGLVPAALGDHDHEAGQLLVFATDTVGEPSAQGGSSRLLMTGLDEGYGGIVVDGLGPHGLDDTEVIGNTAHVREQLAHPEPGLTMLAPVGHRGDAREARLAAGHAGQPLAHPDRSRKLLAVVVPELRLVVEQVDMRRATGHEEPDDAFDLRRKVESAGRSARSGAGEQARIHDRREGGAADSRAHPAEEVAAGQQPLDFLMGIHGKGQPLVRVSSRLRMAAATTAQAAASDGFATVEAESPTASSRRAASGSRSNVRR